MTTKRTTLPKLELPQYITAAAMLVDNCTEQLYILNRMLRLESLERDSSASQAEKIAAQRKRTIGACKLARESIIEIESMLKPLKRPIKRIRKTLKRNVGGVRRIG